MKRLMVAAGILLICLLFSGGFAFAAGNIQVGKLTVLPSLQLTEEYDDNIFFSSQNEADDFITKIAADLGFVYDITGRGNVRFGGSGLWALYSDYSDNDWRNYSLFGDINYKAPAGFYATISNRYVDAEDPYGSDNQFALGQQSKRWTNRFGTTLGYELQKRYRIEGYFNHYKQDYDLDVDFTQNYDQYRVGFGGAYRFMPKTWAFLRYRYGDRDYNTHPAGTGSTEDNDSDFDFNRVNAGVLWDATPKLTGELNFGYKWVSYKNASDISGTPYEDVDFWVAQTTLTYTPTAKTGVTLAIFGDFQPLASVAGDYYKDYGFDLNLSQEFLFDFIFYAGVGYSYNDYSLNDREDDRYRFNLGVDYIIKQWLRAGLYYKFQKRSSSSNNPGTNFGDDNDYDDNRVGLFLKGTY